MSWVLANTRALHATTSPSRQEHSDTRDGVRKPTNETEKKQRGAVFGVEAVWQQQSTMTRSEAEFVWVSELLLQQTMPTGASYLLS